VTEYASFRRFTAIGLERYRSVMFGDADSSTINPLDPSITEVIDKTGPFKVDAFPTAKELAVAVCNAFNGLDPQEHAGDTGLWAWLYFVMIDVLSPVKNGKRKVLEYVRWYPSPPHDYQKAQRHLVRMPAILYASFGDSADHLLCGKPEIGPEIREQLTGQQDMFTRTFRRRAGDFTSLKNETA
jgi:hypothetical protein